MRLTSSSVYTTVKTKIGPISPRGTAWAMLELAGRVRHMILRISQLFSRLPFPVLDILHQLFL